MSKSELFYEEESKTARPHKYSINYKDKNDSVYAIKFYSMQKQIDEKDKEIERLNNIINELENILKLMINHGYYDTPNGDYEGTAVQGFMVTGENSEFGVRAKFILDKLKKLKESVK